MKDEDHDDIDGSLCSWNVPHWLGKGTGRFGNRWKNQDHPDDNIVKIS